MIAASFAMMLLVGGAQAAESSGKSAVPPTWLARINMYRAMAELPPIANDPALTEGAQHHAIYLIRNFAKRLRDGRAGADEMSIESPALPSYTSKGAALAPHCDRDFFFGEDPSPEGAIDRWMEGPLHRMLLLNPQLRGIGYGYYCENAFCVQTVNVVDGIAIEPADPAKEVAIEFPPANSTLSINQLTQESPDPLTACPGYAYPVGLPITFEIGSFVGAKLNSYSIIKENEPPDAPPIEACGYDAFSYRNESRSQLGQVVGRLKAFSGAVVIPRHPLTPGTYRVAINVNGRDYGWSFAIAPNDSRPFAR